MNIKDMVEVILLLYMHVVVQQSVVYHKCKAVIRLRWIVALNHPSLLLIIISIKRS